MKNAIIRFAIFFLAVPAIYCLVLFAPWARHVAVSAIIAIFSTGCAIELAGFFRTKGLPISKAAFAAIGAIPPLASYLILLTYGDSGLAVWSMAMALGLPFACVVGLSFFAFVSRPESIAQGLEKSAAYALCAIYPGLLSTSLVLVASGREDSALSLSLMLAAIFANDSAAWAIGMTLGRKRNLVPVSPNKSLAGFAGGLFGSVIAFVGFKVAFPSSFVPGYPGMILYGLLCGISVIVGDLFESALKRSSGYKDSGSSIPGRGGFLDSFDSLLFAGPVFALLAFSGRLIA